MAASMVKTCFVRLVAPRHVITGINAVGTARWTLQYPTPQQHISRELSDQNYGREIKINRRHIAEKVLTDSDAVIHSRICGILRGRKGKTLKKFIHESGIRFAVHTTDGDYVLVSGKNAEVVKKAVELVTPHINKIKHNIQNEVTEKVSTDDDDEIHYKICGMLIGKEGENIKRIKSETEFDFKIIPSKSGIGHVLLVGTDTDALMNAVEKVTQDIERIRNIIKVSD